MRVLNHKSKQTEFNSAAVKAAPFIPIYPVEVAVHGNRLSALLKAHEDELYSQVRWKADELLIRERQSTQRCLAGFI